jgi:hypothetical protein
MSTGTGVAIYRTMNEVQLPQGSYLSRQITRYRGQTVATVWSWRAQPVNGGDLVAPGDTNVGLRLIGWLIRQKGGFPCRTKKKRDYSQK